MKKAISTMVVFTALGMTPLMAQQSQAAQKHVTTKTTTTAVGSDVDNSKMNADVKSNTNVTAEEQSNGKGDVEITRQIRQAVVKDESLSMNAHNVKIITASGKVILKGPVNSAAEKTKVESLAKAVAGVQRVENMISIKN